MSSDRRRPWPVALALIVLFVFCAWTTDHYWDEYYYLFSVSRHSATTLISLEPALSDGIFPNGFFSGKLGFVVLLRGIVSVVGSGPTGVLIARLLFTLMMLGTALATWLLMREFLDDGRLAFQTALLLLLSPLAVYLGFKVMSEVPALFAATLAGWQFVRAIRATGSRARSVALSLAAIGFAAATLFRLTSVLFAIGLTAAAIVAQPGGTARRRVMIDAAIALGSGVLLSAGVFLLVLDAPVARFEGLAQSVTGRTPGAIVAVYAIALFAQLFAVLLVAALRPLSRVAAAAVVWLAISLLPFVITAQYVEPRFFYTGMPAFALLAAMGLHNLVSRVTEARSLMVAALIVLSTAVLDRALFAPLMPYEIREADYSALVDDVNTAEPGATLVTPWLSDFCYLSMAYPNRRVVLAMSQTYGTGTVFQSREFEQWVGAGRYAGNAVELDGLPRPHVYVGWQYSPTVEALDRYLRPMNLAYLDDPDRRARLLDHLTPSWIWSSQRLRLQPIAAHGAYRAFSVIERDGS